MATGIIAILDDVASLLDDTAALTKLAAKKTGSILVDDMAVNAQQATGFKHDRELPVLWAIAKGSLLNKLIIVPVALLLSALAPWLVVPILLMGGLYLAFEGVMKIGEWLGWGSPHAKHSAEDMVAGDAAAQEARKIKSAIFTDFILSIEIVVLTLGTVVDQPLLQQIVVTSVVAVLATAGVYGLVAGIIRMDDLGLAMMRFAGQGARWTCRAARGIGRGMIAAMPWLIRVFSVIGTLAMVLVGGGIFVHKIHVLHHLNEYYFAFAPVLGELVVGLILGLLSVLAMRLVTRLRKCLKIHSIFSGFS